MLLTCLETWLQHTVSRLKVVLATRAVSRMHQVSMQPPVAARQQVLAAGLPHPQHRLPRHLQHQFLPSLLQQGYNQATGLGALLHAQQKLPPACAVLSSIAAGLKAKAGGAAAAPPDTSRSSSSARASSKGNGAGNGKLPDFIGTPITMEGVIKKINYKGSEDYGILTLQLDADQWKVLKPLVTHKDVQPRAQNQQERFAAAAKKKGRMQHRYVSIKGKGLATLGMHYSVRVSGKWSYNESHGVEVIVDAYRELTSTDPTTLKQKLTHMFRGKGVGPSTVAALVEAFGSELESVLSSPTAVKAMMDKAGVQRGRAQRIKQAYDDATGEENAEQFLSQLGLRQDMVKAAASREGGAELFKQRLLEDPYLAMMDLPGYALKLADDVAVKLNFPCDHPSRGPAAMLQALITETSNGHSFLPFTSLVEQTKRTLVKADEEWAVLELRKQATDSLSDASPSPPPEPSDAQEQSSSGSYTRGATPALPLVDILYPKADGWAARLMERRKIVMELATQSNQPPTRLHQSQWHAAYSTPASAPSSASLPPTGSPTPGQNTQSRTPDRDSANGAANAEQVALPDLPAMARWPPHAMVYLDPLYQAESKVADVLSRLLATTPAHVLPATFPGPSQLVSCDPAPGISTSGETVEPQVVDTAAEGLQPDGAADAAEPAAFMPEDPGTADRLVWQAKNRLLQEGIELTDKQVAAVRMALFSPVMLLTGAAGCGKTFGTKAIMAVLRAQQKRIMLCAPTGRAAQRLQEAGSDYGLGASTIHRLLGYKPFLMADKQQDAEQQGDSAANATETQMKGTDAAAPVPPASSSKDSRDILNTDILREDLFEFNSRNPLPAHAVLVDEASMLDVQLAAALLRALPSYCQLILIGDPNQLPPVGPGAVLQDMINADIFPQVHLDTIFRQSSDSSIVAGAHEVIHQRWPTRGLNAAVQEAAGSPVPDPHPSRRRSHSQEQVTSTSTARTDGDAGAAAPPKLMPAYTMAQLKARIQQAVEQQRSSAPPQIQQQHASDEETEEGAAAHASKGKHTSMHQHQPRLGAVQSLWPSESDDELEDGSSPDAASHAAMHNLQAALGSDGVVVLEDCPDLDAAQHVVQLVTQLQKAGVRVSSHVQVLSATKETHAGTRNLNRLLQPLMNEKLAPSQRIPSSLFSRLLFKEGDRVVQVENNYEMEVFNGDLGHVLSVTERQGMRTMKVLFSPRPGETQPHEVTYHDKEMLQLQLAWATTVHKAQGAEYPVVIMVLHDSAARSLQQRKLLYTAITRGRKLLFLVTTSSALHTATRSGSDRSRNTLLAARTLTVLQQRGLAAAELPLPYPAVALPAQNPRASRRGSRQHTSPPVTYQPQVQARAQASPPAALPPALQAKVLALQQRSRRRTGRVPTVAATPAARATQAQPSQASQSSPTPQVPPTEQPLQPQSQATAHVPLEAPALMPETSNAVDSGSSSSQGGVASAGTQVGRTTTSTVPDLMSDNAGAQPSVSAPPPKDQSVGTSSDVTVPAAGSTGNAAAGALHTSAAQPATQRSAQSGTVARSSIYGVTFTSDVPSMDPAVQQAAQVPVQAKPSAGTTVLARRQRMRVSSSR